MLSDAQIDEEVRKAIQRYAQKEANRKVAVAFFTIGFTTAIIIFLIINLFK